MLATRFMTFNLFSFQYRSNFSTQLFLFEKFVICDFLIIKSTKVAYRTIDILEISNFFIPNVSVSVL